MTTRSQGHPRNYFGMPLPFPGTGDRSVTPVYHDSLRTSGVWTGALEFEITALSPIHVGCGSFGLDGARLFKEPTRRAGVLVIPGTSIKGMCRQVFEALTGSGSPFESSEHHGAGSGGVSAAAAVFGTLGLQGRISFDDAVPTGPVAQIAIEPQKIDLSVAYLPRKPVGRRFYGTMPEGTEQPATVPALAIPVGTVLISTLRFRNLSKRELGEIIASLGVGLFNPRLGGGKYDDFGWICVRATAFRLRPPGLAGGGKWERSPEAVAAFVEECRSQVQLGPVGQEALAMLVRKLRFIDGTKSLEGSRDPR